MKGFNSFDNIDGEAYVAVVNGITTEVSQSFADMTEYPVDELLRKNIIDVLRALRVGPGINIENIDEEVDYFLFTKSLKLRFFNFQIIKEAGNKIYVLREKPNSRFEDKNIYLEQLCKSGHVGVAVYSVPDMILIKANQKYLSFLEYPYNQANISIGKRIDEIITGWKGSPVERYWQEAICTGNVVHVNEYEHKGYQRGITYWDSIITPIPEDGKIKFVASNTYEVTEKIINRKKVQEQKEQLETIMSNISDLLFVLDSKGNYIYMNKTAEKYFAKGSLKKYGDARIKTEYLDLNKKVIPEQDLPYYTVLRTKEIDKRVFILKREEQEIYLQITTAPLFDDKGNIDIIISVAADITEHLSNSKVIEEQKEILEAILDNMQEALFVFNKEGKYIIMNKIARQRFSTTFDKLGDSYKVAKFYDVEGKEICMEETPNCHVKCGNTVRDRIMILKHGEQENYISVNGTPVFDKDGSLLYGIICSRNITEFMKSQQALKDKQEQLLQAEREKNEALEKAIEMKDEFLSLISHEFRTPINVISTAIQALNFICADEMTDKVKEYIGTIKQNTLRQLRLVNNLLDITRANAGRIKVNKKNADIVFLTRVITESVHQYASHKGVRIMFVSSFGKKVIGIDDEKYERILLNLLSNAIKFSSEGKSIVVNLRSIKGSICIEVKDNGIGIPPNKVDVIFERFGQVDSLLSRRAEGTGIGLSLVKKFVEALGGSISVKSKVGKGSTFAIMLPNEKAAEEQKDKLMTDFLDNRLVHTTNVEFSDIYL